VSVTKEILERRKRWVEALRSGKYEQGGGYLHRDGRFCCLGVACDIFKDEANVRVRGKLVVTYNSKQGILPAQMAKFLGIDSDGRYGEGCHSLADDNDDGETFPEIADTIECVFIQPFEGATK
jgi:hypothetical protein